MTAIMIIIVIIIIIIVIVIIIIIIIVRPLHSAPVCLAGEPHGSPAGRGKAARLSEEKKHYIYKNNFLNAVHLSDVMEI